MKKLSACYTVTAEGFLFFEDKTKRIDYPVLLLENAMEIAKRFSACDDITGSVDIIDDLTGEVMATFYHGENTYTSYEANTILGRIALDD